jgi:hypothetical protein
MPPSQAVIATGSVPRGDGGTPEVFCDVAEVFDVGTGASSAPTSTSRICLERPGEAGGAQDFSATVQMNYVQGNAAQDAMELQAGSNVQRNY